MTGTVRLPRPEPGPLGRLLDRRRSVRDFSATPLALLELARLLWSAYGRRSDGGGVVPSAHALRPLSLTVVAGKVRDLPAGAYRYCSDGHSLGLAVGGDHRKLLADATLADADWLASAAALIVLTGDFETARAHFADQPPAGKRGDRYVWLEAGHVSQNVYLAATELGVGAVFVAGFDDDRVAGAIGESPGVRPLGIIGVGVPGNAA